MGSRIGTIYYSAPEQCSHTSEATTQSDMWATGCIIFRFMDGNILFRSEIPEENTDSMVIDRINNQIQDHLPTSYSRHIRSAAWRMLQKDAAERPTARELLAEHFFKTRAVNPSVVKPSGVERTFSRTRFNTKEEDEPDFRFTEVYDKDEDDEK